MARDDSLLSGRTARLTRGNLHLDLLQVHSAAVHRARERGGADTIRELTALARDPLAILLGAHGLLL